DMPGHLHLLASRPSHASHPNERNRGYDEAPEPSHPQEGEESMERPSIRLANGQFNELTAETRRFAEQIGVRSVQMNTPKLPGEHRWEYEDLKQLVDRCRERGLTLEAIENVPVHFYDKAMLGLPGRDEQIEHYQATIRNMGRA